MQHSAKHTPPLGSFACNIKPKLHPQLKTSLNYCLADFDTHEDSQAGNASLPVHFDGELARELQHYTCELVNKHGTSTACWSARSCYSLLFTSFIMLKLSCKFAAKLYRDAFPAWLSSSVSWSARRCLPSKSAGKDTY